MYKNKKKVPARRYGKKTKTYKKPMSLATKMKILSLKTTETKRSSQYTATLQQIFHNKAYYAGSLLATTQGVGDPAGANAAGRNRIGNEVVGIGISLRFFLENVSDHPNVIYKLYVFRYNVLQPALNDTYFWQGNDGFGSNMNRTLDKPQTQRLKILKAMTINPYIGSMQVGTDGLVKTKQVQCWIPLNYRKILYNAIDAPTPRYTDIGFALLAYDAINTPETIVVSNMQYQSTFYYKDP